jgi:hypothetical protein
MGNVYIFVLELRANSRNYPDNLYGALSTYTLDLIKDDIDKLYDYNFFTTYYASLVKDNDGLFSNPDKKHINEDREHFDFKTVAEKFHLIDNKPTTSLYILNYKPQNKNELDKKLAFENLNLGDDAKFKPALSRADYRFMQQYSVQVYESFKTDAKGQWEGRKKDVFVWTGFYDDETGISSDQKLNFFDQY